MIVCSLLYFRNDVVYWGSSSSVKDMVDKSTFQVWKMYLSMSAGNSLFSLSSLGIILCVWAYSGLGDFNLDLLGSVFVGFSRKSSYDDDVNGLFRVRFSDGVCFGLSSIRIQRLWDFVTFYIW